MSENITNVNKAETTQMLCTKKVTLSVLLRDMQRLYNLQEQTNKLEEEMKETFNANFILILQDEILKWIKNLMCSKFTESYVDMKLIPNLCVISEFIWQQTNENGKMSFECTYGLLKIDNPVLEKFFSPTEVIPQKMAELNSLLKDINIEYIYIKSRYGKNYNYLLPIGLQKVIIELKKIKEHLF